MAPKDAVAVARREMQARFGEASVCHNLFVPAYDVEVMEVFDPEVNKWQGVLHVARHHGIEPGTIVAVGDDVNDIPMLANAALGVAMGNARPEVRRRRARIAEQWRRRTSRIPGGARFDPRAADGRAGRTRPLTRPSKRAPAHLRETARAWTVRTDSLKTEAAGRV